MVGREAQIATIERTVSDPGCQLLHIYGPGGIGKTTMLRQFARTIDPAELFYFDGNSLFREPKDWLEKVRASLESRSSGLARDRADSSADPIELLNRYALRHPAILLLLDTFEQFGPIEDWLRDECFPRLNPRIKVVTAGRCALSGLWLQNEWDTLVRNFELEPLSSADVRQYALTRGIENKRTVEALVRFSQGVPLAVSMCCEIISRKGSTGFLAQPQQHEVIGKLVAEMTKDIGDDLLERCAEAASVVWKFDQELLQAMLQESIPTTRFREFCKLPFVVQQEDRWSLHDSVRQWIFFDFRSRMPQRIYQYRQRAMHTLQERIASYPNKKESLLFEKIYLHDNEFVRQFCFRWEDHLQLRYCQKEHIPQVEKLYMQCLRAHPSYVPGDPHLERLIGPLGEIDPGAFLGFWRGDKLIAFTACHQLTEDTVRILRTHPITAPATALYDPELTQHLICLSGVDPDMENEALGSLAFALSKLINRNTYTINLLSIPLWGDYLMLLGYERCPQVDSSSPRGIVYQGYLLDTRSEPLAAKIHRLLTTDPNAPVAASKATSTIDLQRIKLSLNDAVKLVQRALKHYSRLPLQPEMACGLRTLLADQSCHTDDDRVGQRLQREIQAIMKRMSEGTEEERLYYRILRDAYIRKIGTHEVVAEKLHLSNASYYRHLRTAVRKLSYELIK